MSEQFLYTGDDVLSVMSTHAVNRNNFIESLIVKAFNLTALSSPVNLLELGAGRGEFINRFAGRTNISTFVVEPDLTYLHNLSQIHKGFADINDVTETIDFVYGIDVLEHIENDTEVLKMIYHKLPIGGKLLIYVPARMELYSQFDKNIGHFRRYTKPELRTKITQAGFHIDTITYHELLGYFAAFTNKFNKTGDLNPKAVAVYDKVLVPLTNVLEKYLYTPIGKSLYVIATKHG